MTPACETFNYGIAFGNARSLHARFGDPEIPPVCFTRENERRTIADRQQWRRFVGL